MSCELPLPQCWVILQEALAFSRDIFLNIPLIVDWKAITGHHKQHVNDNVYHANKKQCQYGYALVQKVLKKVQNVTKLE
eukprot:1149233-Ditylum_brightwellii.AAC.1